MKRQFTKEEQQLWAKIEKYFQEMSSEEFKALINSVDLKIPDKRGNVIKTEI